MAELKELLNNLEEWDAATLERLCKKFMNCYVIVETIFQRRFPKEFAEFLKKENLED